VLNWKCVRSSLFQPATDDVQTKRWPSRVSVFCLVSASTGALLLCPCDCVTVRDHKAILLVSLAFLFAVAAAILLYRHMARGDGTTAFLKALVALVIVAASVFVELTLAMELTAFLARR
jgi:hypothetical protein